MPGHNLDVTLVLSCITPGWVAQVSDRRLTYPDGSVADDDTTKAVVLLNSVSFGYTGLAQLPRAEAAINLWHHLQAEWVPTHQWLTELLGVATGNLSALNEVLELVCREANASMDKASATVADPEDRKHAFICVGWTRFGSEASLRPFLCSIANYDETGVGQFRGRPAPLGDNRRFLPHASSPLPNALAAKLQRDIGNYLQRSQHPAPVARLLQDAIRSVAKTNKTVGSGLLVTCLPRVAVEAAAAGQDWIIEAKEPTPDASTFLYMPSGSNTGRQVWPGIILPGGNVFINTTSSGVGTPIVVTGRPPSDKTPDDNPQG
jgi:hypothetical protein